MHSIQSPSENRVSKIRYRPRIFDLERLFSRKDWGFPARSSILVSGAPGAGKTTFALALARGVLFNHAESPLKFTPPSKWGTVAVFSAGRQPYIGGATVERELPPQRDDKPIRVYYVSNENDRERLKSAFADSAWFEDGDPFFSEGNPSFRVIGKPVDTSRPVPTSEELINSLTHELRQEHAKSGGAKAIIIVDSLSSLLRDCRDRGEERRQSHEFIHRLEAAVGKDSLALVFFLSEETSGADSSVVLIEEYVVHFVFRLRLKDTGLGRRLRVLEVVKSHGIPLHLGEHTWSILTSAEDSIRNVISPEILRKEIQLLATTFAPHAEAQPESQTSPEKVPPPEGNRASETGGASLSPLPSKWCYTGIPGLDEMLNFGERQADAPNDNVGRDYWIHRELGVAHKLLSVEKERVAGLRAGSTTVLVGRSGAGKMTMCLQFLLAGMAEVRTAAGNTLEKTSAADAGAETKLCLYINFERPYEEIVDGSPLDPESKVQLKARGAHIFRRRGNLDVNALMAEIRFVVKREGISRVAIDGLSSLLAARSAEESTRLVENLVFTFEDLSLEMGKGKRENYPITIFLTYEPENAAVEPLIQVPRLSAFADNLIVFRTVAINDHLRQTVHIAKARRLDHDHTVREVHISSGTESVSIEPGLETFTGIFSANSVPEKVQLVLQLFHENKAEEDYNQWLNERLHKTFGYETRLFGFSRSAITPTLEELGSPSSRIPPSNVKVFSLDEWEVHDGARDLLHLKPFEPSKTKCRSLASESDFWAWEIGKVKRSVSEKREVPAEPKLRAMPCYLDFGLFCINLDVAREFASKLDPIFGEAGADSPPSRELWSRIADRAPRLWTRMRRVDCEGQNQLWFAAPCDNAPPEQATIVDWMRSICVEGTKGGTQHPIGFAFDLAIPEVAAVTFLELAWAFGAPENVFARGNDQPMGQTREPVELALRFLMFLVAEGLMPKQVSAEDSKSALFSRHFYSTLCDAMAPALHPIDGQQAKSGLEGALLIDRAATASGAKSKREIKGTLVIDPAVRTMDARPPRLMAIPFFPTGIAEETARLRSLCFDIVERLSRFLGVIEATIVDRRGRKAFETCDDVAALARNVREAHAFLISTAATLEEMDSRAKQVSKKFESWTGALRCIVEESLRDPCFQISRPFPSELAGDEVEDRILPDPTYAPQVGALDCRDLIEFYERHRLRWQLFREETSEVTDPGRGVGSVLAQSAPHSPTPRRAVRAATGYGCTGSWMVGAHAQTHSAGLSCQLIDEITSLESTRMRANWGAGLPARKDFYEYYGRQPATHAPYLAWNDVLRACGSRARQRNRAIDEDLRVSDFNAVICRHLRACLHFADLVCERGLPVTDEMIRKMIATSDKATKAIFEEIAELPRMGALEKVPTAKPSTTS